jgi:nucleoid DNA-binding protein
MSANTKSAAAWTELLIEAEHRLGTQTKKETERVIEAVVGGIEEVLVNNLPFDQFTLKLGTLGKFSVRHKPSVLRKISFTGEIKRLPERRKVVFRSLGQLREKEVEK